MNILLVLWCPWPHLLELLALGGIMLDCLRKPGVSMMYPYCSDVFSVFSFIINVLKKTLRIYLIIFDYLWVDFGASNLIVTTTVSLDIEIFVQSSNCDFWRQSQIKNLIRFCYIFGSLILWIFVAFKNFVDFIKWREY